MRENKQDLTKRRDDIAANMEVHMVDKVTDKVANMVVEMADSKKINKWPTWSWTWWPTWR